MRGWQVQVHAIGDAAIRQALDAFVAGTPERRHRIEHIEAPSPLDIPRFAELGVIASMQPQHAEPNRNLFEVWLPHIGAERAACGWPWRSILHSGARIAFGTDWPVVPMDPAATFRSRSPPNPRGELTAAGSTSGCSSMSDGRVTVGGSLCRARGGSERSWRRAGSPPCVLDRECSAPASEIGD